MRRRVACTAISLRSGLEHRAADRYWYSTGASRQPCLHLAPSLQPACQRSSVKSLFQGAAARRPCTWSRLSCRDGSQRSPAKKTRRGQRADLDTGVRSGIPAAITILPSSRTTGIGPRPTYPASFEARVGTFKAHQRASASFRTLSVCSRCSTEERPFSYGSACCRGRERSAEFGRRG